MERVSLSDVLLQYNGISAQQTRSVASPAKDCCQGKAGAGWVSQAGSSWLRLAFAHMAGQVIPRDCYSDGLPTS